MTKKTITIGIGALICLITFSLCKSVKNERIDFEIREFSDSEYPDNPDIGYRAKEYRNYFFKSGSLLKITESVFDLEFISTEKDSIILKNIDLRSWLPSIPKNLRNDSYLAEISLINQEWNRNQVAFSRHEFVSSNAKITRVDLARNCLNSYLWEIILYTEEAGEQKSFAHGWFNFPKKEYEAIFTSNNEISFEKCRSHLAEWKDPESKFVDKKLLREETGNIPITYSDLSDEMYVLAGERKKKFKEIVNPTSFKTMRDLQTDQTTFATFSKPGFYNRSDPRKTELGRILKLESAILKKTKQKETSQESKEIEFVFLDKDKKRHTKLIIGGLDFSEFPHLTSEDAHKGWQNSMGFGNHTFYESYQNHIKISTETNPYYAFFTDESGNWLDSHKIGIDGPLIYFDAQDSSKLHVWLLSFERHALVGHYVLKLK